MTPQLGPRASLLLGMLGEPMTAAELLHGVEVACDDDSLMDAIVEACDHGTLGGSPAVSLRALSHGGLSLVERLLERLHELGMADYLDDPEGVRLWRRTPVAAWS